MSDRYTRQDAEAALDRLLTAIGGRRATAYNDVDGYWLDYNPIYGGVQVHQVTSATGSVTCPFGYARCTPREFVARVRFATDAFAAAERH